MIRSRANGVAGHLAVPFPTERLNLHTLNLMAGLKSLGFGKIYARAARAHFGSSPEGYICVHRATKEEVWWWWWWSSGDHCWDGGPFNWDQGRSRQSSVFPYPALKIIPNDSDGNV
jgi:hypothetical protein